MKTTLLAAALIALAAPAFASSEAPVTGTPRVITSPAFTTAGSEGPAMFLPARPDMRIVAGGTLPLSAEGYVGQRG